MALVKGDTGSRIDEEVQRAAEAFGLQIEEDQRQSGGLEVWPENETTVRTFIAMGTQWNTGMAGVVGLRYEALPCVLDLIGVPAGDRAAVFGGLRVMEQAALQELRNG